MTSSSSVFPKVLPDDLPELSEYITVELISVSGDAVIVSFSAIKVFIRGNDDQFGVVSIDAAAPLDVYIDEDSTNPSISIAVVREQGTYGQVSEMFLNIKLTKLRSLAYSDKPHCLCVGILYVFAGRYHLAE